jgi:hypothetical protein
VDYGAGAGVVDTSELDGLGVGDVVGTTVLDGLDVGDVVGPTELDGLGGLGVGGGVDLAGLEVLDRVEAPGAVEPPPDPLRPDAGTDPPFGQVPGLGLYAQTEHGIDPRLAVDLRLAPGADGCGADVAGCASKTFAGAVVGGATWRAAGSRLP